MRANGKNSAFNIRQSVFPSGDGEPDTGTSRSPARLLQVTYTYLVVWSAICRNLVLIFIFVLLSFRICSKRSFRRLILFTFVTVIRRATSYVSSKARFSLEFSEYYLYGLGARKQKFELTTGLVCARLL